jgi:hypothetical protein
MKQPTKQQLYDDISRLESLLQSKNRSIANLHQELETVENHTFFLQGLLKRATIAAYALLAVLMVITTWSVIL